MKWTIRPTWWPTAQPTMGGSTFEVWFDTRMNGPVRGTCSTPSIRASNRKRPSPPAMTAPGCQNQLRTDLLQALDDRLDAGIDAELAGVEDERVSRDAQRRHRAL